MDLYLKNLFENKNIELLERFTNSRHVTFEALQNGKKIIIKTHETPEERIRIQNELDWYNSKQFNSVKRPKLLGKQDEGDHLILFIEYIDGESLQEKLAKSTLEESDIEMFANFTQEVETMDYLPTVKSEEKKNTTSAQWNELFQKNTKTWYESINQKLTELKLDKYNSLIDSIYNLTSDFDINKVGFGGQHGSPKFSEYIKKDDIFYVVDWENTTSYYIKYYMTASISSYMLSRLNLDKEALKYLGLRSQLLSEDERTNFQINFPAIFSHRLLGNIFDLVNDNKLVNDEVESAVRLIGQNLELINKLSS